MSLSTLDFNSHFRIGLEEAEAHDERAVVPVQDLGPNAAPPAGRSDRDLEGIGARRVGETVGGIKRPRSWRVKFCSRMHYRYFVCLFVCVFLMLFLLLFGGAKEGWEMFTERVQVEHIVHSTTLAPQATVQEHRT